MGCCFSSDEDKDVGVQSANERTPLIPPPGDISQPSHGGRVGPNYTTPNGKKDDGQSEFTRIIRQTAINVIDVTSPESQNIEQGEMQDRATQYSNRLNMALSGKSRVYRPNLPLGVTSPQMTLSAAPVSMSDVQLITSVSEKLTSAAKEIKIQHKENLVVNFGGS
ncbi:ragulator complex protein LAMTOR1 [Biomphalaria glabrata]|uniref:Ragulator complex protein LAMTOR1 n=1 Tax=Biomphalaria glabrata TaxID=6526 RepID=A0A2C9LJR4_BIOGL|nr:ragulator complex protein LAMTOR1-like [Biomphalaria glabrata]KAI8757133.1 ragulator complex protein LAMTOR1-like [Biomphalaria glabrata]KAI8798601.1 ragulator complex protein LAMTOR1 [Biomphalaria glabrata]